MANRDLTPWTRGTGLSLYGGRDPFASFRREMDRLFEDFFTPTEPRSFAAAAGTSELAVWPRIDLHETEQAYTVTAELPGIDPKDVELNLRDNALIISGEKRTERKQEDQGRRYSERSFGRFERVIPLETEVDADKVKATCDNGVLTITLPKSAQAHEKARRIEVQPGAGAGNGGAGQTSAPQGGAGQPASGASGQ